MKVKILANGKFTIAAIMKGDSCPTYDSLNGGLQSQYQKHGNALLVKLDRIATDGFDNFSSSLSHLIHRNPNIYELIHGQLRLVYFHGGGKTIVVCTEVIIKKSQKADPHVVDRAKSAYRDYFHSIMKNSLIEIKEE